MEWDEETSQSYVSVSYNGDYYPICDNFEFENPKKSCVFLEFYKTVGQQVNASWEEFCNFGQTSENFNAVDKKDILLVEGIFASIIFMIFFVVLVIFWKWKISD